MNTDERNKYYERKRREEYKRNKKALEKKYEKLPDFFKKKIDRLKADDPENFWRDESYEIFVFVEAMKIVKALKTEETILESWKKGFEEQKRLVPDLSIGHSGNSFGCINRYALEYLTNNEAPT